MYTLADCLFIYILILLTSFASCFFLFFFQAEDGIRDLVRSRGLGDVYKRQLLTFDDGPNPGTTEIILKKLSEEKIKALFFCVGAVSYTHLTLPTSDLV